MHANVGARGDFPQGVTKGRMVTDRSAHCHAIRKARDAYKIGVIMCCALDKVRGAAMRGGTMTYKNALTMI